MDETEQMNVDTQKRKEGDKDMTKYYVRMKGGGYGGEYIDWATMHILKAEHNEKNMPGYYLIDAKSKREAGLKAVKKKYKL